MPILQMLSIVIQNQTHDSNHYPCQFSISLSFLLEIATASLRLSASLRHLYKYRVARSAMHLPASVICINQGLPHASMQQLPPLSSNHSPAVHQLAHPRRRSSTPESAFASHLILGLQRLATLQPQISIPSSQRQRRSHLSRHRAPLIAYGPNRSAPIDISSLAAFPKPP